MSMYLRKNDKFVRLFMRYPQHSAGARLISGMLFAVAGTTDIESIQYDYSRRF